MGISELVVELVQVCALVWLVYRTFRSPRVVTVVPDVRPVTAFTTTPNDAIGAAVRQVLAHEYTTGEGRTHLRERLLARAAAKAARNATTE